MTFPGNLLGFLIGIKPFSSLKANADAERNPLDSMPENNQVFSVDISF